MSELEIARGTLATLHLLDSCVSHLSRDSSALHRKYLDFWFARVRKLEAAEEKRELAITMIATQKFLAAEEKRDEAKASEPDELQPQVIRTILRDQSAHIARLEAWAEKLVGWTHNHDLGQFKAPRLTDDAG